MKTKKNYVTPTIEDVRLNLEVPTMLTLPTGSDTVDPGDVWAKSSTFDDLESDDASAGWGNIWDDSD